VSWRVRNFAGFLIHWHLCKFCVNHIFSSARDKICAEETNIERKFDDFLQHVDTWQVTT